jgi:uncharacterized protein YdaU (DUF1376 family)
MMPWFPGDFMRSTRGWSVTARGVYRELLDAQWDMGELPSDLTDLRLTIGATIEEWAAGWKKCADKFPLIGLSRRNARLEAHRSKSEQIASKRSAIGKLGGQASAEAKSNQRLTEGQPIAQPIAQANLNHPLQSTPIQSNPVQSKTQNGGGEARAKRSPTATRFPDDFNLSPERAAYAVKQGIDPQRTFEDFRDYWRAASGQKSRKHDWEATWQMWCRNQYSKPNGKGTNQSQKPADPDGIPSWATPEERAEILRERGANAH